MLSRSPRLPSRTTSLLLAAVALYVTACSPSGTAASPTPPSSAATPTSQPPATSSSRPATPSGSPSEAPTSSSFDVLFPFTAEAISGFYLGEGLTCEPATPSTTAAGWTVTTCSGADAAGRPVAIGLIADEGGDLGAGFATVTALPDEELLEPTDALDALSGFLGAMLGEDSATELLPWLASQLGNDYAETTVGEITVATYIESPDDPTRIYLEVDGPEYLAAPAPP